MIFYETGSFLSAQKSLDFVQEVAPKRIESMIQIAQRLKAAFMVDVTSGDMTLLFEAPDREKHTRRTEWEPTR